MNFNTSSHAPNPQYVQFLKNERPSLRINGFFDHNRVGSEAHTVTK